MRLLKEDWEGIDYKGYTIEFDRDGLERAIENAKEDGHLTYEYTFHIKNIKGTEVSTAKSLKQAREFIDKCVIDELINFIQNDMNYCLNWEKEDWYDGAQGGDWQIFGPIDYRTKDWDVVENEYYSIIKKLLNIKYIEYILR